MMLALAVFLCAASGAVLVSIARPLKPAGFVGLFCGSLALGYGIGLFSIVFVLARALHIVHLFAADLFAFILIVAGSLVLRARFAPARFSSRPVPTQIPRWLRQGLAVTLAISACAALYSGIARAIAFPHGEGWDAFSIWNLHARFLFRSPSDLRMDLSPLIPWSHPDYPLLLPGAIAHFWTYLGHESQAVPAVLGLLFAFSTAGVLLSSLAILRGSTIAMLGGLALLTTPFFIEHGTSQYADVPLSFFILAALASLNLRSIGSGHGSGGRGLLLLAGLGAGFAAWTKNEGLLFLVSMIAAWILVILRKRTSPKSTQSEPRDILESAKDFTIFAVCLAPAILLIVWFKHVIAPPGDLFTNSELAIHKLADPSRYLTTLRWYGKEFLRFGHWLWIPGSLTLIALYFFMKHREVSYSVSEQRIAAFALALTFSGYFVIYLITPYDLFWHLRFSLNRLFLQLWPSVIFLVLLAMSDEGKPSEHAELEPASDE